VLRLDFRFFAVSARTGEGLARFGIACLNPGTQLCLLGSSGVGKSTLLESFLQRDAQVVATGFRVSDSRGRHTTTSPRIIRAAGWRAADRHAGLAGNCNCGEPARAWEHTFF